MNKMITLIATSAIALTLTIACSSKPKAESEAQTEPMPTTEAVTTPEAPVSSIPDETATVASLGASSSGRSR